MLSVRSVLRYSKMLLNNNNLKGREGDHTYTFPLILGIIDLGYHLHLHVQYMTSNLTQYVVNGWQKTNLGTGGGKKTHWKHFKASHVLCNFILLFIVHLYKCPGYFNSCSACFYKRFSKVIHIMLNSMTMSMTIRTSC